jgi:transcriptional regulator with XRE-family HTH domain
MTERIRQAMAEMGLSQAVMAEKLHISASQFSEYLTGNRAIPDDVLIRLSDELAVPLGDLLLLGCAARCARAAAQAKGKNQKEEREVFQRGRDAYVDLQRRLKGASVRTKQLAFTSLEEFPFTRSGTWVVVLGDRRESPPKSLADFAALSAATPDIMFLLTLGLPRDTVVCSDKVVVSDADPLKEPVLRDLFGSHLLVVGSPAVSLVCREIMRASGATFMFNIPDEVYQLDNKLRSNIDELDRYNPKVLQKLSEDQEDSIKSLLANLRVPGFVDPVAQQVQGFSITGDSDYGIVALSPNPWSENHVAVICAGVHGPGTAGAVQMLGDPAAFADRPWGSVIKVTVPQQAPWAVRFKLLNPEFKTNAYAPQEFRDSLEKMLQSLEAGRTQRKPKQKAVPLGEPHQPVRVSRNVLEAQVRFADRLAKRNLWSEAF